MELSNFCFLVQIEFCIVLLIIRDFNFFPCTDRRTDKSIIKPIFKDFEYFQIRPVNMILFMKKHTAFSETLNQYYGSVPQKDSLGTHPTPLQKCAKLQ